MADPKARGGRRTIVVPKGNVVILTGVLPMIAGALLLVAALFEHKPPNAEADGWMPTLATWGLGAFGVAFVWTMILMVCCAGSGRDEWLVRVPTRRRAEVVVRPARFYGSRAELVSARLKAAVGPCAHAEAVPVETLDGETVAWLCPGCDEQLPAEWVSPAARREALERDHRERRHGHPGVVFMGCRLCAEESLPPFVPDPRLTKRIAE